MIKERMFEYVKVVSHLSNIVKQNKVSDDLESMLISREKGNILKVMLIFLKFAM